MYVHMVGRDEESRGGGEVCIIPVLALLSEHRDCIDSYINRPRLRGSRRAARTWRDL